MLRGAYLEFPPLTYTNASGEPVGEVIEWLEAVADKAGYRISWQELPLGRIHLYLKTGEIDFWPGASGIPALKPWVKEADVVSGSIRLAAYYLEGQDPVYSVEELESRSLILLRSYTYLGILDEVISASSTSVDYAPNISSGLQMLQRGRGDYLVSFERPVEYLVSSYAVSGVYRDVIFEQDMGLLFSTANLRVADYVRQFEEAASTLYRRDYD